MLLFSIDFLPRRLFGIHDEAPTSQVTLKNSLKEHIDNKIF